MNRRILASGIGSLIFLASVQDLAADWTEVRPGLDLMKVPPPGNGQVWSLLALRADPARWQVVVLSAATSKSHPPMTVDDWAAEHDLTAVVNAGMYQKDGRTPVGYLRSEGREVGRHWRRDWQAALVAGPQAPGRPDVTLLDASCDGSLPVAARGYRQAIQGIRMLTCRGENTFRPGGRRAARLAVGVDGAGRLLFVFHRQPVTGHDFVERVRETGIEARRLMYLEGGSEASLVVRLADGEVRLGGIASTEIGRWTLMPEGVFLPIPHVIGLRPRDHVPDSPSPRKP